MSDESFVNVLKGMVISRAGNIVGGPQAARSDYEPDNILVYKWNRHLTVKRNILGPNVLSSIRRKRLTRPALRTFFRIADAWGLEAQEQMQLLGLGSRSTYYSWKRGEVVSIPKDALERISYIIGIHRRLHILLPESADEWIFKLNKAAIFGGGTALKRMTSGNIADLFVVHQYLDGQLT